MIALELIMIILGLPLLGGLMLLFAVESRSAIDRYHRHTYRSRLRILSWVAFAHIPMFLIALVANLMSLEDSQLTITVNSMVRISVILMCVWLGLAARRVSDHEERDDLSPRELASRDQQFTSLLTGSLVCIGLPLLLPGVLVVFFFSVFLLLDDFLGAGRRIRENRLLWTLSLAVQHDLPLSEELLLYTQSIIAEKRRRPFWTPSGFLDLFRGSRRRQIRKLKRVINDLKFGIPLGQALLGTSLLPPDLVASIRAAETAGDLKTMLPEMTVRHTRQMMASLNQESLTTTVCYVWFVSLFSLQVLAFVMYFIVPKYKDLFEGFGVNMPPQTERLINLSEFLSSYWYLIVPLFALLIGGVLLLQRLATGNHRWIRWLLRWFPRMESPQILDQLAMSVSRSNPLPEELDTLASSELVDAQRRRLDRLKFRVASGDPLPDALHAERLINRREQAALTAATHLDHLPWTLRALSRRIQQHRRDRSTWIVRLTEPALILMLGAFVLVYCLGMFVPLVKLLQDLA